MTAPEVAVHGTSDVGRVREANEDDYYVGESIVAVADGMGGHLAGEVASKTALEPIQALDGASFGDPSAALRALREAVVAANATVSQLAEDEPTYRGMGTTLTAAMFEDHRLHLAHVGDSRAYLLRGGTISQLTDDHTLVQHLVDEGQITREEAAHHPQRSIITRAIGVSREVEVDAMSIELEPGDQVLLCSDGLTGVVGDADLAAELGRGVDAEETLRRLVDAANRGGGPDNITAVLLRYGPVVARRPIGDDETGGSDPVRIGTRDDDADADWAGRLGNYGARDRRRGSRDRKRLLLKLAVTLLGVAVVATAVVIGGRYLLDRSYFVGLDDEDIVIYQGVDLDLGPISLARIVERSELTVQDVAAYHRELLADGLPASDLEDARRVIAGSPRSTIGGTSPDTTTPGGDATTGTGDAPDGSPGPGTDGDGTAP